MEITCYRPSELGHALRTLPAALYNLAITLRAQTAHDCLFVPIRSMQYLAIWDAEECVFIHATRKSEMDLAWREFHPQHRNALSEVVPYRAAYYQPDSAELMPRLQMELGQALTALSKQQHPPQAARILKFPAPTRDV